MFISQTRLTVIVFTSVALLPALANAALEKNWSPYASLEGGLGLQKIYNVNFKNPRLPHLIQNSHNSAVPSGAFALGTGLPCLPLRLELRTTINGQSNFNREYFFPNFMSVVGVQKLNIRSNDLMLRGYWDLPFQVITPYLSLGAGATWNKTIAMQYAPQLPGWIHQFVGTTRSSFAWSAGVGVTKALEKHFTLNAGFNYVFRGNFNTGGLPKTGDEHISGKLYSNELLVGFSYYL